MTSVATKSADRACSTRRQTASPDHHTAQEKVAGKEQMRERVLEKAAGAALLAFPPIPDIFRQPSSRLQSFGCLLCVICVHMRAGACACMHAYPHAVSSVSRSHSLTPRQPSMTLLILSPCHAYSGHALWRFLDHACRDKGAHRSTQHEHTAHTEAKKKTLPSRTMHRYILSPPALLVLSCVHAALARVCARTCNHKCRKSHERMCKTGSR